MCPTRARISSPEFPHGHRSARNALHFHLGVNKRKKIESHTKKETDKKINQNEANL
jgi:hypothetical protein